MHTARLRIVEQEYLSRMTKDEMKAAAKEAITEWLDAKLADFGRWSIMAIGAAALGALAYAIIWSQGWRK